MSQLLKEKKNENPMATNSFRQRRKKTMSPSRSSDDDKTVDSDTTPELVKKPDDENHRLSKLEKCLKAIASRNNPRGMGVGVYFHEWDQVSYLPRFEVSALQTIDGQGSLNQHIFRFKSQTGNVASKNVILVHLLFGTIWEVAFEWFVKLPDGSIHMSYSELEMFFLMRFFEDDVKAAKPTIWLRKKRTENASRLSSIDF